MANVLYIFDLEILADSRAQKEISFLLKSGHSVSVLEWNKGVNYSLCTKKIQIRGREINIDSIGIKVDKGKGFRSNIRRLVAYEIFLWKYLKRNIKEYDVVHCCNLDTSFLPVLIAKREKKSSIYDIYDDYADSHSCSGALYRMIKKIDEIIQNKATAIIICSEKRVEQLSNPMSPVYVVHNAPDITPFADSSFRLDTNKFKIAYVGNLAENRMIRDLVEVVKKHRNWELHCGGDGVLCQYIKESSIKFPNIYFYGVMRYEDVISLESQCNVIPALYDPTLPNNKFAAPNKFYEALSLGKPTIMVEGTGMDDVVACEKTGEVITPNRLQLESALTRIEENSDYWNCKSSRLKELFRKRYSWEKMEITLSELYEYVLSKEKK